jgi:hypothetical protein
MSPKSIQCPNCTGPVKPDPASQTLLCSYCNHHFENPIYKRQTIPRQGDGADRTTRNILLIILLPTAIGMVIAIVSVALFSVRSCQTAIATTGISSPQIPINPATRTPTPAQAVSPDVALELKLDRYIDCMARAFPRAQQSMERYRSWVDMQRGPTCKERYVSWGLYAMYADAPKRCHEQVGEANAAEPQLPTLHQAATEFVTAAASMEPVMKAASEYYDKAMYKVDNCAKGKAFHLQLVTLYNNFHSKQQILSQNIEHYSKGALDRCLAQTAADPEAAAAHQWAVLIKTGGAMIEAFRVENRKKKPSLDLIKGQIAAVTQAQGALDAMSEQHKEAAGYHWSHKSDIDKFVEGAVAFLSSGGGKRLNSSARFFRRNGSPLKSLDGTFENLLVRYNEVLADYEQNKYCGRLLPCEESRCPIR